MKIAWVLGGGGLLGKALIRGLRKEGAELFVAPERLRWSDAQALGGQLAGAMDAFAGRIGADDQWEIYWAAGVGTMSSPRQDMVAETEALGLFLQLLGAQQRLILAGGSIGFASSAGAIYAGSTDEYITEDSHVSPLAPYAHAKLRQEDLIRSFIAATSPVHALIARITTLYGVGQDIHKPQGLLTHIARSILTQKPIQIYVPFDTIRDYINADDAALSIIDSLRRLGAGGGAVTKIIASEHPSTIAEIIATFKRVSRRTPRVITSASRKAALYARRVQFRSIVLSERRNISHTSLLVGIAQLLNAERQVFVRGQQ